ncbi:MAG: hypothetical protein AB1782_13495 [Cyanobacteriota bacterium]
MISRLLLLSVVTIFVSLTACSNPDKPSDRQLTCVGERNYEENSSFYIEQYCYEPSTVKKLKDKEKVLSYNIVLQILKDDKKVKETIIKVKTNCLTSETEHIKDHWYVFENGKTGNKETSEKSNKVYSINEYFTDMQRNIADLLYESACAEF